MKNKSRKQHCWNVCAGAWRSRYLAMAVAVSLLGVEVQAAGAQESSAKKRSESVTRSDLAEAASPSVETSQRGKETGLAAPANVPPSPGDYVIGEQDNLTITVWKERDISGSVVVRPDGKITVPLVGELKVIGMTPLELQNILTEKLKPFVTVPQVTVAVNQINSRKVYLIGQVMREGTFEINSSTTVLQIVAQAGGLKDFAKRKKIYILRQEGSKQTRYNFNYDSVIRGNDIDQNIQLEPGDTIVVP